jgi:hypothetical protein
MQKNLSLTQAANRLDLSPQRVRQLFDSGDIAGEWTPLGRVVFEASVIAYRERTATRPVKTGRYSQRGPYQRRLKREAGLKLAGCDEATLRKEGAL